MHVIKEKGFETLAWQHLILHPYCKSIVSVMKILSRMKPAVGGETSASSSEKKRKNKTKKTPKLEDYLNQRDYLGALTLLEVQAPLISVNKR